MRWPIRYQIMVPMAVVMLLAVLMVEGVGVLLSVRDAKARIDGQIREVEQIALAANFPLTAPVLRQMRALSGAELIVVDGAGQVIATSGPSVDVSQLSPELTPQLQLGIAGSERVEFGDRQYFHAVVPVAAQVEAGARLHILFPEDEYERAWQREVLPPLAFVAVALPIVLLLAYATSSRIARRVSRLREQVNRIAKGDFQQLAAPQGDDEIRALAEDVNRMSAMLAGYEQEVRRTERMRTLALLGGGIAHQLRNSATGCAMAVDIHAEECPLGEASESLQVAKRQLRLMEEFIQRFLQLGKPVETTASGAVDLQALVENLLPLVRPAARHAGVDLQWEPASAVAEVDGSADRLGQVIVNLLLNAIEAAPHSLDPATPARVQMTIEQSQADRVMLTVSDSGPGPAAEVGESLFEPFVSEKTDGVGLGLAVVREIVEQHGGRVGWRREDGMTRFTVELPTVGSFSATSSKPLPAGAG